jgi:beta-galactosidase
MNLVVKCSFFLPDFNDKTEITFYAKSLSENQSLYVNGKLLAEAVKRDAPDQVYVLDHNILKKGENVVVFVGKPIAKKVSWEEISTNPGEIKIYNPAAQWKRKLFNGFAQIIVKSSNSEGEITLKATSGRVQSSVIKINSKSGNF